MSIGSNLKTTQEEQGETYKTSLAYLTSCSSAAKKEGLLASDSAPALVAMAFLQARSHFRDSSRSAPSRSDV